MAIIDSSDLCVKCGERPRLGALSRCRPCVQAVAEVDRQNRAAAEARVAAREHGEAAAWSRDTMSLGSCTRGRARARHGVLE
jgi:hypothetical protein